LRDNPAYGGLIPVQYALFYKANLFRQGK